jgi:alpha-beta hydrolase superfamily lysophospholipase
MLAKVIKLVMWALGLLVLAIAALLALRAWDAQDGPPLELWHTFVPHELNAAEIDKADWAEFLAAEQKVFDEVRVEVTDKLAPADQVAGNRYFANSPIYPGRFATDWNRSYIMKPAGTPVGAVVLLHGLTDSPYSLRHIAQSYRDHGYVAVAIRLPGHGSVPSGLSNVDADQWMAATRLAVREARRLAGPAVPLHMVGFSTGGALAMKYALDALDDKALSRPDRIVLTSPMIGITSMARFAGIMGWPAVFPSFAKAAWLGIVPEFNPFKYNSFPVNGARQTSLVADRLQAQISSHAREGRLAGLAPILTFQSVVDFTVSTRAIVNALYVHLPANGSELVLFDLNRAAKFGPLLRSSNDTALARLLPPAPRNFTTAFITNVAPGNPAMQERLTPAGSTTETVRPLDMDYPRDVFSLSHLALTFPIDDSLYGMAPTTEDYGVQLGALATRGERGTLIVSLDSLIRMSSNPFFPYLLKRIEEGMGQSGSTKTAPGAAKPADAPQSASAPR